MKKLQILCFMQYSGYALCAEGFMLNNDLLTVVGALIGSSGTAPRELLILCSGSSFLNGFIACVINLKNLQHAQLSEVSWDSLVKHCSIPREVDPGCQTMHVRTRLALFALFLLKFLVKLSNLRDM